MVTHRARSHRRDDVLQRDPRPLRQVMVLMIIQRSRR